MKCGLRHSEIAVKKRSDVGLRGTAGPATNLPAHRKAAGNCPKARHLRIFGVVLQLIRLLHSAIQLTDLEMPCVIGYFVSTVGKKQRDSLLGRRQRTMLTDQR
jgi:hypothetical protein